MQHIREEFDYNGAEIVGEVDNLGFSLVLHRSEPYLTLQLKSVAYKSFSAVSFSSLGSFLTLIFKFVPLELFCNLRK